MMMPAAARRCPYCARTLAASGPGTPQSAHGPQTEERSLTSRPSREHRRKAPPRADGNDPPPERLAPALGQETPGSWANIKVILRHDPLLAIVLAILAASAVLQFAAQAWLGAVTSALILWGIVTFRWWGYWFAMFCGAMGFLGAVIAMFGGGVGGLVALAMNGFVLGVLYSRRDCFD
jgi:hypothetical protein